MNVAVIAWGSTIWAAKALWVRSRWKTDGPALPVEFARISPDGRLALVLYPGYKRQRTYWAISEMEGIDDARGNLRLRDRCKIEKIHSYDRKTRSFVGRVHPEIQEEIQRWLARKPEIDAAIWTDLGSNWLEKRHKPFSDDDALAYMKELWKQMRAFQETREYVCNTPLQIQTRVRELLRHNFCWIDRPLAGIIFESAPVVDE